MEHYSQLTDDDLDQLDRLPIGFLIKLATQARGDNKLEVLVRLQYAIVGKNIDNAKSWLFLARTLEDLERYEDALHAYEKVLFLDRQNSYNTDSAENHISDLKNRIQHVVSGVVLPDSYLDFADEDWENIEGLYVKALIGYSRQAIDNRDWHIVEKIQRILLKKDPDNANAHGHLAIALKNMGDVGAACEIVSMPVIAASPQWGSLVEDIKRLNDSGLVFPSRYIYLREDHLVQLDQCSKSLLLRYMEEANRVSDYGGTAQLIRDQFALLSPREVNALKKSSTANNGAPDVGQKWPNSYSDLGWNLRTILSLAPVAILIRYAMQADSAVKSGNKHVLRDVIEFRELILQKSDNDSVSVLRTWFSLALAYRDSGQYKKALGAMQDRVLPASREGLIPIPEGNVLRLIDGMHRLLDKKSFVEDEPDNGSASYSMTVTPAHHGAELTEKMLENLSISEFCDLILTRMENWEGDFTRPGDWKFVPDEDKDVLIAVWKKFFPKPKKVAAKFARGLQKGCITAKMVNKAKKL
ncbi:hypothetical protein KJ764_01620 [Patescibacteria group bacterium]|nr:hypothetical protein [Patescibacteria group bacterium]